MPSPVHFSHKQKLFFGHITNNHQVHKTIAITPVLRECGWSAMKTVLIFRYDHVPDFLKWSGNVFGEITIGTFQSFHETLTRSSSLQWITPGKTEINTCCHSSTPLSQSWRLAKLPVLWIHGVSVNIKSGIHQWFWINTCPNIDVWKKNGWQSTNAIFQWTFIRIFGYIDSNFKIQTLLYWGQLKVNRHCLGNGLEPCWQKTLPGITMAEYSA